MNPTRSGMVCAGALAMLLATSATACGGSGSTAGSSNTPSSASGATASPSSSPAAVAVTTGCSTGLLPKGYVLDAAHSGKLTAHNYSAAADVQAALEFDQLQGGAREVYLLHSGKRVTNVVSCVAMRFPSAHVAGRFFMSYRSLRKDAGSLVQRLPVPTHNADLTGVTEYLEKEQSFRGYKIPSTDVIELSGQGGARLDIVSVSGATPSKTVAHRLLLAMAAQR